MKKITENLVLVYSTLSTLEGKKGFAFEVLEKLEGKTFNSVNASLSSLATKGLVSKEKKACEKTQKFLTFYTIIKDLPTDTE